MGKEYSRELHRKLALKVLLDSFEITVVIGSEFLSWHTAFGACFFLKTDLVDKEGSLSKNI